MTNTYTADTALGPLPRGWWFSAATGIAEPIPYGEPGFDPMVQSVDLEEYWQGLQSSQEAAAAKNES